MADFEDAREQGRTGWRMARAPGGRRVAMRWIRKQQIKEESSMESESSCAGCGHLAVNHIGGKCHLPGCGCGHMFSPLFSTPQMNLSAAVATCVASSYGEVPAKEMDPDETTQVTVVARIGGAR